MAKLIRLINNKEYIVSDNEAEQIKNLILKEVKFIEFSSGEFVNVSSISSVGELEKKPYWRGCRVYKEGTSGREFFQEDGNKLYLETQHLKEIEYEEDLKYALMPKMELKRLN